MIRHFAVVLTIALLAGCASSGSKLQPGATRAEVEKERLRIDRDKNLARIQRVRDQQVQRIQNEYKVRATFLPPIPPLLVGLVVWARRRVREREGVSRTRMKTT